MQSGATYIIVINVPAFSFNVLGLLALMAQDIQVVHDVISGSVHASIHVWVLWWCLVMFEGARSAGSASTVLGCTVCVCPCSGGQDAPQPCSEALKTTVSIVDVPSALDQASCVTCLWVMVDHIVCIS